MKKALVLLVSFLFLCCGEKKEAVAKPDRLLKEEEMVDILYDIAIFQSMNSYSPVTLQIKNLEPSDYIYRKYTIDSATFAQNHVYYASDIDRYEKLNKKVVDRLKADKAKYDSLVKAQPEAEAGKAASAIKKEKTGSGQAPSGEAPSQ